MKERSGAEPEGLIERTKYARLAAGGLGGCKPPKGVKGAQLLENFANLPALNAWKLYFLHLNLTSKVRIQPAFIG